MIKRLFDISVSAVLLIILMPLMTLLAILIKLESAGNVIFRQQRVGRNGEIFSIYKFRSMVVNASAQGPYFTRENDSRVTRVGRFVRKTSLDELPQLINVLKGDMSLVGPRPNIPEQEGEYTPEEWNKRNSVRPGITGLAQATLRSAATYEERTRLDLEYVDKSWFLYDIKIILMTMAQIFGKGGY